MTEIHTQTRGHMCSDKATIAAQLIHAQTLQSYCTQSTYHLLTPNAVFCVAHLIAHLRVYETLC